MATHEAATAVRTIRILILVLLRGGIAARIEAGWLRDSIPRRSPRRDAPGTGPSPSPSPGPRAAFEELPGLRPRHPGGCTRLSLISRSGSRGGDPSMPDPHSEIPV